MIKKVKLLTLMFVLAISTAFVASPVLAYDETSCSTDRQDSTFFVNEYSKGYTAQIEVMPNQDKMFVTFYDRSGHEVKLDGVKTLSGQIILTDGSRQDVMLLPERSFRDKEELRLGTSTFIARGEWIGSAAGFSLKMDVPVEGDTFEMAYSYGCEPSGSKQLVMLIAR